MAIVTGAGGGLGRGYALALAGRGCKVVVNDVGGGADGTGSGDAAERVVAEIVATGGEAVASAASVAERAGAAGIAAAAIERWGRLDILINNAGILRDRSFAKTSLDDVEAVLAVHLLGSIYVTHAAWPWLIANGFGRVVMTTSTSALYGNFGQSAYDAAKLGVVGLMNALKLEGERHGIAVNTVAPVAATRLANGHFGPAVMARLTMAPVIETVLRLCAADLTASGVILEVGAGQVAVARMTRAAVGPVAELDRLLAAGAPQPASAPQAIAELFQPLFGKG